MPVITYSSSANYGGITRDDGAGAITLAGQAQFTLDYLDANGNSLALPLEASSADPFPASAIQNVKMIRLAVQVQSSSTLTNGQPYTASAGQTVSVRNLNCRY